MVESAFEFADICRKHDYHNFVFSMKASNPLVMVQAYRLLAEEMYNRSWDYPLHLGVTGVVCCGRKGVKAVCALARGGGALAGRRTGSLLRR
jgi:4-hydroxy-3-methylbut-2-en-1-yl diphosphate synthase IspG/GcpE